MEYRTLGRTGLNVSVMGLGAGGPSRLGRNADRSEAEAVAVVRAALDAGVNLIDTAEAYRTEEIVGAAVSEAGRDGVVLSTKKSTWGETPPTPADVVESLEASLRRLRTDRVDIYHLHAVGPQRYPYVREHLVAAMLRLREQGKIRFLGITEGFERDGDHRMLQAALADDCWDVAMVGFNLLNPSARRRVFPATRAKGVGTLIMYAVRRALSRPERLREVLADLVARGKIAPDVLDGDPLARLTGDCVSLPDAAYRFCVHEPGCDAVLSGTGDPDHLRENIASCLRPDVPPAQRRRLEELFAAVDDVSGD